MKLPCLKQLLNDVIFIQLSDKKLSHYLHRKKLTERPTAAIKNDNVRAKCCLRTVRQ